MDDINQNKDMYSISELTQNALTYYQSGNLKDAESVCLNILEIQPDNGYIIYLTGLIYSRLNNYSSAIDFLIKAAALNPSNPDVHYNLANALQGGRRYDEALISYRRSLDLNPRNADAYNNLGTTLLQKGELDEAITSYQRAISMSSDNGLIYNNLGNAFRAKRNYDGAVRCYQEAINRLPDSCDVYNNMGNVYADKKEFIRALTYYEEALQCSSGNAQTYYNMANAFKEMEDYEQAEEYYQKALCLNPDFIEAYYNLGNAQRFMGKYDAAIHNYGETLKRKQDYLEAYNNLGVAFKEKGDMESAIISYKKAVMINPNIAETQWNLSLAYLLSGNFEEGWKRYEWRWQKGDYASYKRNFSQPQWEGEDISGKVLYLHAEQGYGDAIQFVRYTDLIAQKGTRVILEAPKALLRLFMTVKGVDQVVRRGDDIPDFDFHCPLLSLPRVFGTVMETVPAKVPYICADPELQKIWHEKLLKHGAKFKVGLVWSGNPEHKNDRNRSVAFDCFIPLLDLHQILFFSLQKGETAKEATNLPEGLHIIDYADELNDFADTAGLIMNLDLIVTVDTATAHLAGALGKPVWTMLPYAPDWRWLLGREDSIWYPTMKLFRQQKPGDWASVVRGISECLTVVERASKTVSPHDEQKTEEMLKGSSTQ